jgi:hypothetical protein
MGFIMGLTMTQSSYDSLWVVVDRLVKVAHSIPIETIYIGPQLVELYISRIVYLYVVPKWFVSARGTQFISLFWERLHETMDTCLNFSSAYHPQINGHTERVN